MCVSVCWPGMCVRCARMVMELCTRAQRARHRDGANAGGCPDRAPAMRVNGQPIACFRCIKRAHVFAHL